ncbi:DNRLRE domain-containing protein [Chloroflexota bacterium]
MSTRLKNVTPILVLLFTYHFGFAYHPIMAEISTPLRRVNVPYLGTYPSESFEPTIFWFGEVTPSNNYVDVRVYYYDGYLKLVVHIIDRLLWYDRTATTDDLADWDAVSVYLDLDGKNGGAPSENSFRFISQLNWFEDDSEWQAAYRGDGNDWSLDPIAFTTSSAWRGQELNSEKWDSGWHTSFIIPFTSLGLSSKPPDGANWGLSIAVHDRDGLDIIGSSIPDQVWPESMEPDIPASWGKMVFGLPTYQRPLALAKNTINIRQGLNGASVVDAHVGGHTNCSRDLWEGGIWDTFGTTNYAGSDIINIQNQWDISDFACFSKYYVTFPLDGLPPDQLILSATLTMHLFGTAGGGQWGPPPDSYIVVSTVGEDWYEATINWNNAPRPSENVSGAWVKPMQAALDWPGESRHWDLSRAVAEAYENGDSHLRLALYSIDGDYHTGKYFSSSDRGDWAAEARPTLSVTIGQLCDSPGIECHFNYLPFVVR